VRNSFFSSCSILTRPDDEASRASTFHANIHETSDLKRLHNRFSTGYPTTKGFRIPLWEGFGSTATTAKFGFGRLSAAPKALPSLPYSALGDFRPHCQPLPPRCCGSMKGDRPTTRARRQASVYRTTRSCCLQRQIRKVETRRWWALPWTWSQPHDNNARKSHARTRLGTSRLRR
jgi:hypothetical protein